MSLPSHSLTISTWPAPIGCHLASLHELAFGLLGTQSLIIQTTDPRNSTRRKNLSRRPSMLAKSSGCRWLPHHLHSWVSNTVAVALSRLPDLFEAAILFSSFYTCRCRDISSDCPTLKQALTKIHAAWRSVILRSLLMEMKGNTVLLYIGNRPGPTRVVTSPGGLFCLGEW